MVKIRTVFINTSSTAINGVFKASNLYGRAIMTSCDMYFNGQHFIASVIDPSRAQISASHSSGNPEIPFDPNYFTIPFSNCPPSAEIIIDLCYIQDMKFNSSGSYELLIPLQIPQQPPVNAPPRPSSIKCILDVGTQICQWRCNSHQMYVVEQTGPSLFMQHQYRPSSTAAVALQSPDFPAYTSRDFFVEYNGMASSTVTGSCLLELPPLQYHGQPPQQVRTGFVTL